MRMKSTGLATRAIMLALTVSGSSCCVPRVSQSPHQILELQSGQTHTAATAETWHSDQRYRTLEQELINAIGALKQRDNK